MGRIDPMEQEDPLSEDSIAFEIVCSDGSWRG